MTLDRWTRVEPPVVRQSLQLEQTIVRHGSATRRFVVRLVLVPQFVASPAVPIGQEEPPPLRVGLR